MSVAAIGPYEFAPRDVRGNFPAPLLYVGWDDHLMFCSPVCLALPPDMPFGAFVSDVLPGVYGAHPEFASIDWSDVRWLKSGHAWTPDPARTLAENGLEHKDAIRLQTPGLRGIRGSHS